MIKLNKRIMHLINTLPEEIDSFENAKVYIQNCIELINLLSDTPELLNEIELSDKNKINEGYKKYLKYTKRNNKTLKKFLEKNIKKLSDYTVKKIYNYYKLEIYCLELSDYLKSILFDVNPITMEN